VIQIICQDKIQIRIKLLGDLSLLLK